MSRKEEVDWKTPYELLFKTKLDLSVLRPFGCLAYVVNLSPSKGKFDSRCNKCVPLGFESSHKGYLLYDMTAHELFTSRDVRFVDIMFPYSLNSTDITNPTLPLVPMHTKEEPYTHTSTIMTLTERSSVPTPLISPPRTQPSPPLLRRCDRVKQAPVWMQDHVGSINTNGKHIAMSKYETPPIFPYHISHMLSSRYVEYLFNLSTLHEPITYKEASRFPEWVDAMKSELDALEHNETLELVTLPQGKAAIRSKWVYKL